MREPEQGRLRHVERAREDDRGARLALVDDAAQRASFVSRNRELLHPYNPAAMSTHGIAQLPPVVNEPVRSYAPGTPERAELKRRLQELQGEQIEITPVIGGERVRTGDTFESVMPHRKSHVLAEVHQGGAAEVERAATAAREAHADWARLPWEERAAVFLRAADLLAGPWRQTLNAATMLGQSKTAHQAEIDAACELIDFWRFNVEFTERIYREQPISSPGIWNRMEHRPLEGFVFAVTPFNFTAIARQPARQRRADGQHGDLEAGLDGGVQRLVPDAAARGGRPAAGRDQLRLRAPARAIGDPALAHPELAGMHFTGSTGVFNGMWKTIGDNVDTLPQLPADRRRDRRQGLHRRAPERRRRRARDRDRARRLRVPGAEVLRGLAGLRAEEPVAEAARASSARRCRSSASATWRTSRTSWAP